VVKAFIILKPDMPPGPDIEEEIKKFVKTRLAAHEYPREIECVSELPMTATGKIMRRELKKLEIERKSKG
jgi:acetyl-CoA synthetase